MSIKIVNNNKVVIWVTPVLIVGFDEVDGDIGTKWKKYNSRYLKSTHVVNINKDGIYLKTSRGVSFDEFWKIMQIVWKWVNKNIIKPQLAIMFDTSFPIRIENDIAVVQFGETYLRMIIVMEDGEISVKTYR